MKQKSRTEYSVMNTTVAFLAQTLAIFMGFFTRVVFTRTLSEGYVGINGLFTDILNILSLSELGVGTAITYALYAPIARRDIKKQQILMRMFRNFYRITAGFVLLAGLCLIPFLDILMKDRPDVNHLIIIYLLYLLNSVVSYLLIYKKTLVDAHQMNYITVMYHNGFLVLQDILQIMVLFLTRNFILFLVIAVVCTIIGNICMSRKADRLFPYLKEPCKEQLPQEERHDILRNVKAMLMHKIGNVVVNNTDNLLISSFVGIISAGIYSNYYLIIGSVRQVLEQAMLGVAASVGNLGVTEENEKIGRIFDSLFFIGYWLFGFAGVCLLELLNPFVKLAFGKKYLFPKEIVLILCINFFINGMRRAVLIFKESMGLFWNDRYKAIAEAVLNLVISILLVTYFGVAGVFAGTFCSTVLTSVWVEPYVIYKYRLKKPVTGFFVKYAGYLGVMAAVWGITEYFCRFISGQAFMILVCRLGICLIVPNILLWFAYRRTAEWKVQDESLQEVKGDSFGKTAEKDFCDHTCIQCRKVHQRNSGQYYKAEL